MLVYIYKRLPSREILAATGLFLEPDSIARHNQVVQQVQRLWIHRS